MIEEKLTISINGKRFEAPGGEFMQRNAQSLLLAGYLRYLLIASEVPAKLEISAEDQETINNRLSEVEDWLQPAISSFGDVVASIDVNEVGKYSLAHVGFAITAFSELLQMVQEVRRSFEEKSRV